MLIIKITIITKTKAFYFLIALNSKFLCKVSNIVDKYYLTYQCNVMFNLILKRIIQVVFLTILINQNFKAK